jgi:hypothetical protein
VAFRFQASVEADTRFTAAQSVIKFGFFAGLGEQLPCEFHARLCQLEVVGRRQRLVDEVSVGADAEAPGPAVRTAGEAGDASLAAALAGDWVEDEIFEVYSFGGRPKLDLRAVAVVATGEEQGAKDEGRERKQDS